MTGEPTTRPLTFPEWRHWFLSQWDNGTNAAYHNPVALRLRGVLRVAGLQAALDALVRRHDVLHTVYTAVDGDVVARLVEPEPVAVEIEDLSSVPADQREAVLSRMVGDRAMTPFRLDRGPLLRAHLFVVSPVDHVLLLLAHHIVIDGWSLNIVCQEIETLYNHAVRGKELLAALAPPGGQYAEFAAHQLEGMDEAALQAQVAYWRERLAGLTAVELPTDRPRGVRPMEPGPSYPLQTSTRLRDGVVELARRTRTTPFMVVLGALSTLLSRLSGRVDVAVGCPSSARSRAEYPDVVGCFVNMLVFRNDLGGNPTFEELLTRVRSTATGAYGNQDVPFERLVSELRPAREKGRQPFFETTLTMHPLTFEVPSLLDLEVEMYAVDLRMTFAELSLNIEVASDCIRGDVMYDASLFDPGTVAAFAQRFEGLLDAAVARPELPVSELPVLLDRERAALARWNDSGTLYERRPVPELVLAQAARTPGAAAVTASDATLSYEELVGRAAQVAWHLRELGVTTGAVVGILVPRTTDLLVGMLGTLFAGGAYLPLDPTYPPERLRFMLDDAGVGVVLTAGSTPEGVVDERTRPVRLDVERRALDAMPRVPPPVTFEPRSTAYMIYTSGSTGRPKGVVVEHGNVAALVEWATGAYSAEELRLVGAPTSLCFDISVFELYVPLAVGGTVLLLDNALELAPGRRRPSPTLVNSVPSAMEALVHVGGLPPSVRTVNVCGEPLSAKLLGDLLGTGHVTRVCNLYGPSEDTVYSTVAVFGPLPPPDDSVAPHIGTPLPGTQAWVLDDLGQPVAPGIAGELFLGGEGVVRGYHDRPSLTAERFVPDPFGGRPGGRLYRTGDLVRWRHDGVLEFLGRRDHQVKVRGHRIELSEVELCLLRHPRVREAVVVVTGSTAGDRALAAFVTLDGHDTALDELERFVAERLPSYMVPQQIAVLDELPRTPNGKVDRKALPSVTAHAGAAQEPATETERALAAIWCSVLDVEAVHRDDDFFRLGGQSLLAMQIVARVRDTLGVELPLPVLFDERTLRAVAGAIDESRRRVRAKPVVRRGRVSGPLDPSQAGFLEGDQTIVPAVASLLRLTGALDVAALEAALNEVARRHEALRTVFRTSLGRRRQVVLPWDHVPLVPVRSTQAITDLLTTPFDLAHGPLVRWALVQHSKREHVLAVAAHEAVADGWSVPIILTELATVYADVVEGREASLPEPLQYLDVVLRRRRSLRRRARAHEVRYWRAHLRDAPVAFDLLPDRWPTAEECAEAREEPLLLDRAFADRLRAVAADEGCTLYMVLFAAFQAALHRWSGEPTVLLRSTVANRTLSDMENVVGFFVNHVLVPTDVSGNPSFRELLRRVRDEQLEVAGHTNVPYRLTAGRAARMRTESRGFWPFGRLRFQVLDFPHNSPLELPGLKARPEPAPVAVAEHFTMAGFEHPDRSVEFSLAYDGAWFERTTIKGLLSLYQAMLGLVADDPEVRVDDVPLLDERGVESVVRVGRGRAAETPFDSVPHAVAEHAKRTPTAVAVVCGERSLTYGELDRAADAVALHVSGATESPEARVVVAAEGAAGVVAMLGVMRAGALCIPVLSGDDLSVAARVVEHARADLVLDADDVARITGEGRVAWTAPTLEADGAALALYCSGRGPLSASVLTHGGLARAASALRASSGVRRTDRWGVLPAARVGRLLAAVWPALASGAAVVLASDEAVSDPARWAADQGITLCSADARFVPDLVAWASENRTALRALFTDEPVCLPDGRLRVQVEEAVWAPEAAMALLTSRSPRTPAAPAFAGTPTPGTHVLVLDASLRIVPPGVLGQVYVDASSLARGYLDDPRTTAERFVPAPHSGRPGARMVSTGLVGRVTAKGSVEVLGPASPIAMRGLPVPRYAVQLEHAVRSHPAVAAACARPQPILGEPRLVLYVERRAGGRVSRREILGLVPEFFPAAARPAEVVFVDAMPRTLDGRVDIGTLGTKDKRHR